MMDQQQLQALVLTVAEQHDAFCMDNALEREALALAIAQAVAQAVHTAHATTVGPYEGTVRADGSIYVDCAPTAAARHLLWLNLPAGWSVEDEDNGEGFVCMPPQGEEV